MIIKQLSLFLENKPGHLARACQILADAGLNVESMALADTEQFGILRFLIRDWEKARQVLTDAGAMPRVTDVLAIAVPNRPGGLVSLLSALDGSTVNIVISASPVTSKVAFERVFDARALENTAYLVFVNNKGTYDGMVFFGGSRVMNPDGSQAIVSDVEGTTVFYYDPDAVEKARKNRPVIADTVSKIEWQ